jgi:predicted DNA-binding mobile mystery protein A
MPQKFKQIQLTALDKKIKKVRFVAKPKYGWANVIRSSIAMPLTYVAKKIGVSPQSIFQMEKGEVDETISLKTLRRLAESIGCELHYAFIPRDKSLKKIIQKRAEKKARMMVKEVDKSMSLENQKLKSSKNSVKFLTKELSENLSSKLWEDEN